MRSILPMKFQRKILLEHRSQRNQTARLIAALDMVLEWPTMEEIHENRRKFDKESGNAQEGSNLCPSFVSKAKR